ncbi:MAG: hypothetical protein A4E51_00770 [Methanosaeta sp. PtaU1.Bin055]|nr:MAG: hypothetical protein A4E51_00770 [Methanosaeta sp. PtaU1.Bin055]
MTSTILRPFLTRVEPVSVRSTTASASSGTFASVAPKEFSTSTGIPRPSKNFFVMRGYSVEILDPGVTSLALSAFWASGTATTTFTFPGPCLP